MTRPGDKLTRWSDAERTVLRGLIASGMDIADMPAHLPGRTNKSIYYRLDKDRRTPLPNRAQPSVLTAIHVSRDPCPRCGVLSDLGCRHGNARFATVMGL